MLTATVLIILRLDVSSIVHLNPKLSISDFALSLENTLNLIMTVSTSMYELMSMK